LKAYFIKRYHASTETPVKINCHSYRKKESERGTRQGDISSHVGWRGGDVAVFPLYKMPVYNFHS
jgi:hypothetical protein